ncbi:hypothetical protein [Spirosoma linguale]|uniref:Uncharacterized protein n=1 Tax=Spirosoma linguale (strain ATCC 33905 / DSM 74 / LMG 10896 / Claus 1) TaxID=504472 RepID=D2QUD4_SPILD|nr:hypothetical protein Slin_6459 [Spirosoma linguale DSM 74]
MILEEALTATVINVNSTVESFMGYVAVSHVLMQTEGFADFLFDNFRMIEDITTDNDSLLGLNRFVMQSIRFVEGYGQYKISVERSIYGDYTVKDVCKVR